MAVSFYNSLFESSLLYTRCLSHRWCGISGAWNTADFFYLRSWISWSYCRHRFVLFFFRKSPRFKTVIHEEKKENLVLLSLYLFNTLFGWSWRLHFQCKRAGYCVSKFLNKKTNFGFLESLDFKWKGIPGCYHSISKIETFFWSWDYLLWSETHRHHCSDQWPRFKISQQHMYSWN